MDKKRYQVFVSSTFADLPEERQAVFQMLMRMDCIPAGMEFFGAVDEEQFEFIKKVIDDCDYYVVIIGGRYGTVTDEGVSYTEKEYDYAVAKGIKVIGLLHKNPANIPSGKTEHAPEARAKLAAFREKVRSGRLIDFWETADQLKAITAVAMVNAMKMYPAVGWVRADQVTKVQTLTELNQLRKENEKLKKELTAVLKPKVAFSDIAGLDETIELKGRYKDYSGRQTLTYDWDATMTWRALFGLIAPSLMTTVHDAAVRGEVAAAAFSKSKAAEFGGASPSIDDQVFNTVRLQFMTLRQVSVDELRKQGGGSALYWSLTSLGKELMLDIRVVRTAAHSPTG